MDGVDVRRILVDQGSSVDILFKELLPKLKIAETDLSKHDGTDLVGFNGSRTTPMGYVRLQVTYGEGKSSKKVDTNFLVLPCPSPYHGIVGRPTLGKLGAVASTVHLKMRFYSDSDEVVTVPADLDAARRCQYLCLKAERMARGKQWP